MNLTKGHNNLTKLNEIASCICGWFNNQNNIWIWIGIFISSRNFIIILCFQKSNTPDVKYHIREDHSNST